jgi:hypothetical protein
MTFACAYNLFGHRVKPDLYCAVPEDRPVPVFLDGSWRFAGRLANAHGERGFSDVRVDHGVRLNGYFLFFACNRADHRALAA